MDATAGGRMMWFDKKHPDTIYLDKKKSIRPTIQASFEALPFPDETFDLVVFDPPHTSAGQHGIFYQKFGALRASKVIPVLYRAARELLRVLKNHGVLIFKWNTHDKPLDRVLSCFPIPPLFGQRTAHRTKHSSSTFWVTFIKKETV